MIFCSTFGFVMLERKSNKELWQFANFKHSIKALRDYRKEYVITVFSSGYDEKSIENNVKVPIFLSVFKNQKSNFTKKMNWLLFFLANFFETRIYFYQWLLGGGRVIGWCGFPLFVSDFEKKLGKSWVLPAYLICKNNFYSFSKLLLLKRKMQKQCKNWK